MLWGALCGDWPTSLGIAVFFELLWVDLSPAGTYIPPHSILPTLLCLSLGKLLGLSTPWNILPLLGLAAPLAWVGSKMESWQRIIQNGSFNRLLNWAREDAEKFRPKILIHTSLLQILFMNVFLFVGSFCLLFALIEEILPLWPAGGAWLAWPHLWMLALVGPISGLRLRKAYFTLLMGAFTLLLLVAFLK